MSGTSVVPCRQPPEGGRRLGFLPRGVLHPSQRQLAACKALAKIQIQMEARTAILAEEFRQPGSWGKLLVTPQNNIFDCQFGNHIAVDYSGIKQLWVF